MTLCNTDVVKQVAKFFGTSPGAVSLTSDKVVTCAVGKETVSGFATVLMHVARKSQISLSNEQALLDYQWLEYAATYANHASTNPTFAKKFLQEINSAVEYNSYLTGQSLSVADVALCLALNPLVEALSWAERESLNALCRWSKHVNARVKSSKA